MGQRRGARGAGLAPRRKGLSALSATSLSLCPGPGGSPKGPSEPWLPTPPPAYSGLKALCSAEAERAGPGAGRDSQPPGPTAGASRAASAHSWKSSGRAGARGPPAPRGEIGRKARARPRAWAPPSPAAEHERAVVHTFPKGLHRRAASAQEPGGPGGAAELAERPKPGEGGEGISANPRALRLSRCQPTPLCWAPGPAGGACACL